ncbi:alpha/beta hydrolase [Roseivirga sp.]|uniref:alpha/beta hydrolase n=1 Tax=Roseivirga sp. TaxID=1964215 RepID=UPI003B52DFB5
MKNTDRNKWLTTGIIGYKGVFLTTIYLLFTISFSLKAQDYSDQLSAMEKSFAEKDTAYINQHLSKTLQFKPIPVANTPAILNNIFTRLPFIGMKVLGTENGLANIQYEFQGMGTMESAVHFNDSGKIERIELIENLIKLEMEQQRQLRESVQVPGSNDVVMKFQPKAVSFQAKDGLKISGNLYEIDPSAPVILLCHQAGYNKAEYLDIAPRLNELGYNCLAIDQRSGGPFANQANETATLAQSEGKTPTMLDARQDITAAINYLSGRYDQKVIVWGSSYSSSLALMELNNSQVKAVIAFSPGNYFGEEAQPLQEVLKDTQKPYLVTSSKTESEAVSELLKPDKMNSLQMQFIPESDGFHGSRAVWIGQKGAEEYWNALKDFLKKLQ